MYSCWFCYIHMCLTYAPSHGSISLSLYVHIDMHVGTSICNAVAADCLRHNVWILCVLLHKDVDLTSYIDLVIFDYTYIKMIYIQSVEVHNCSNITN